MSKESQSFIPKALNLISLVDDASGERLSLPPRLPASKRHTLHFQGAMVTPLTVDRISVPLLCSGAKDGGVVPDSGVQAFVTIRPGSLRNNLTTDTDPVTAMMVKRKSELLAGFQGAAYDARVQYSRPGSQQDRECRQARVILWNQRGKGGIAIADPEA